jgi:transketolase
MMKPDTAYLADMARLLRSDVVTMVHLAGDGHPGPALSIADIVAALYFGNAMRIDPDNPLWPQRDRLILSKGHACPVVYAALARRGFFSVDVLPSLRSLGSMLQGHPDMHKTPGIDMTSGSLGNGISLGLGMAVAGRYNHDDYQVYVITGDGELQEGIVWEAAMAAVHYRAGRLVVFVDHNGLQSGGEVGKIAGLLPILPKWEAFGWHCQEIDGHDLEAILGAIQEAREETERPSLILARTVKGKGVPFMEHDNSWHKRVPTKEECDAAVKALGGMAL